MCVYTLSVQNIRNTCSFHDIDWPGESRWSYHPLLMSLVKSTSISVDEGEETGYRRICKPWHMDCVCESFRGSKGETKDLSAFAQGMVVGARRPDLNVSRTVTLLGFSWSTVSRVCQGWSSTKRTSSQFDTTVGSIGVNMGQHPRRTLSTPCRVHATTNWGCSEKRVQPNNRMVFIMFCTIQYTSCTYHCTTNRCVCARAP
jgi:hypothetical protein